MGDKSEKKRNRRDDEDGRPKKKAAVTPTRPIRVELLKNKGTSGPLLIATPGLAIPRQISFQAYQKTYVRSASTKTELLLQSSEHASLDYSAKEERDGGTESEIQDYIGVFDSVTNKLQLMPVKRLTLRSTLRSEAEEMREVQAQQEARRNTMVEKRQALAVEFGSKKSRKVFEERSLNQIHSGDVIGGGVADTILENMATSTGGMPSKKELMEAMDSSKPRPIPNLAAEFAADVYTADTVVGSELMTMLEVKDWVQASTSGTSIELKSRYVAKHINKLVKTKQIQKLKLLRFIAGCIDFHALLSGPGHKAKKILPKDKLEAQLGQLYPQGCIMALKWKFGTKNGEMPRWNVDNLITHIAAAALIIDDQVVDVNDLREDLGLDNKAIRKYFTELGCRVKAPSPTEMTKHKLTRADALNHYVAKLTLPLQFPRTSGPRQKKR